jgi:hypothetical protein
VTNMWVYVSNGRSAAAAPGTAATHPGALHMHSGCDGLPYEVC